MKIITEHNEFEKLKSNDLILLECYFCKNNFNALKKFIKYELKINKGKFKFCSRICYDNSKAKIKLICKNCNKEIEKNPSEIKKSKSENFFCDKKCSAAHNNIKGRVVSAETKRKISKKLIGVIRSNEYALNISGDKNGRYKDGKYSLKKFLIEPIERINNKAVKKCKNCEKNFEIEWKKRKTRFCSKECASKNFEVREKISRASIKRCNNEIEKNRMREIGKIGGFGKKGYTNGGIYYQSKLEKECFEFLENNNIIFEPHKYIPNSSKISDLYIKKINLWIELDGIDREKRKKWLGKDYDYWIDKLKIYDREKLNYKIIKNFEEFKKEINNMSL
jgi:hypothetical protein